MRCLHSCSNARLEYACTFNMQESAYQYVRAGRKGVLRIGLQKILCVQGSDFPFGLTDQRLGACAGGWVGALAGGWEAGCSKEQNAVWSAYWRCVFAVSTLWERIGAYIGLLVRIGACVLRVLAGCLAAASCVSTRQPRRVSIRRKANTRIGTTKLEQVRTLEGQLEAARGTGQPAGSNNSSSSSSSSSKQNARIPRSTPY